MYNKAHSIRKYIAIITFIVISIMQCTGINRNVIVSNAESKTDSSVQNETDVNITEDNTERTNNTLSIQNNYSITNDTNKKTSDNSQSESSTLDNDNEESQGSIGLDTGNIESETEDTDELHNGSEVNNINEDDNGEDTDSGELTNYITGFDIQDLKGNSIINDGTVFNRYQAIKLVYDFEIPKKTQAKNFSMTIDECILIQQKMVADLTIDNEKIGEAIFNTDHTVDIKFEENTFTSNLKGKFYIQTYFDQEALGDTSTSQTIKFNIGGTSEIEIPIKFQEVSQDEDLKSIIVKDKIYDSSTQTITWKIYVAPNGADMSQGKIIDKLQPHQEFIKDSVEIFDYQDKSKIGEKLSYKYTESTRVLSINGLSFVDQWITVSFKTKVDPEFFRDSDGEKLIKNTASFRLADDENKVKYSNECTVNLTPNLISKYGEWNRFERKISWTLKVNQQMFSEEDESKLKLKNCIVTDVLPDCLELDSDSGIYLDGRELELGEYEYVPSTALTAKRDDAVFFPDKSSFSYEYVSDDPDKCGELKIYLGDIDKTHEIKFTTDIKNELYQKNFWSYVVNEASLITDGDDSGDFEGTYTYRSNPVYITMSPISKMAIENGSHWIEKDGQLYEEPVAYNPRDRILLWQIGINTDGIPINNATITDKLQDGLKYMGNVSVIKYLPYDKNYNPNFDQWDYRFLVNDDGSLRYYWTNPNYYGIDKPGGEWVEPNDEFNCDYDENSNTVTFKINNNFNSQYVIYFETKIVDPSIYASNGDIKIENSASIKFGDSEEEVLSNTWVTTGGLTKSEMVKLNAINYDCISHKITWSGIVNRNKLSIKGGNIFDEIENDQKYVDGSFKVEKYDINTDESTGVLYDDSIKDTDGNFIHGSNFSHVSATEDRKESLNYYLGDGPSDETYLVTFETQVTDESIYKSNIEKAVINTLSLKGAKDADAEKEYENLPSVSDTAEINVKSSVIQKEGVFHPETETIDWSIAANINMLHLKDAIIEDRFQEGLDLDINSVKVYPLTINPDGSYNVSEEPLSEDKYQIEDYNPEDHKDDENYLSDQRILNVKFIGNIQEPYMLKFTTKADIDKAPFYNKAYFKGTDEEGNSSTDSSNQVKIPGIAGSVGADVEKEEGSILAFSVYGDDTEPLAGAEFEIYYGGDGDIYNPNEEVQVGAGKVDDETGKIKFRQLVYGWYKVMETKAPDGHKLPENPEDRIKYVRITSQGCIELVFKSIKISEAETGTIKILKTDENGNPLEGAKFMLKTYDGAKQDMQISHDDGIVVFDNVPFGSYSIEEVQAPRGYKLNSDNENLKNIIVNSDRKDVELVVKNDIIAEPPIEGSINITKVAEEDKNKKLEGAKFNLYTTGDYANVLSTKVSDSNGLVVFDGLPEGIYDIKEIDAPDGYEISKVIYKGIKISSDSEKNVDIEISNKLKRNDGGHSTPGNGQIENNSSGNSSSGNSGSGGSNKNHIEDEEEYYDCAYNIIRGNSSKFNLNDSNQPEINQVSDANNGVVVLPQAGKMIDTKVIIIVGLMFINAGIYLMIKKNIRKQI